MAITVESVTDRQAARLSQSRTFANSVLVNAERQCQPGAGALPDIDDLVSYIRAGWFLLVALDGTQRSGLVLTKPDGSIKYLVLRPDNELAVLQALLAETKRLCGGARGHVHNAGIRNLAIQAGCVRDGTWMVYQGP
jgi:hypothetical protein